MRNFFKDTNGNIFEYSDRQVAQGLADDKTLMTSEEVELFLNPPKTEADLIKEKKQRFMDAWDKLVIEFEGNVYSCKKSSMTSMELVVNNEPAGKDVIWYEDWAEFHTTPEVIGQVLQLAFTEKSKLEKEISNG